MVKENCYFIFNYFFFGIFVFVALAYHGALVSGCPCYWQRRFLHALASLSCPPETAGWVLLSVCTRHPHCLNTEPKYPNPEKVREKKMRTNIRCLYWGTHTDYLHILDNDRKAVLCAVSCKQVLAVTGEGEKLAVKSLEVRLAKHQTLAWTQGANTKQ